MTDRKCPECNGRNIEHDEARGERVCAGCGHVVEERMIDWNDRNHTCGEQSHCTPTRRRHVGRDGRNRTGIDQRDINNRQDAAFYRTMRRANEKQNTRANDIIREMEAWGFGDVYIDAANEALLLCFTNEVEKGRVKLKRPYHQMRDMVKTDGKDDIYVIRVSMISTMMALSDFCLIPYYIWKGLADCLGLDRNDCSKQKRRIKRFLHAMFRHHHDIHTRYIVPHLRLRTQALDAWFDHLRDRLDILDIERREELMRGVAERLERLGEPGPDADLGEENPDTLTAVVTQIVAEELNIEISKEAVAGIFYFSAGGMNAPLQRCANKVRARA